MIIYLQEVKDKTCVKLIDKFHKQVRALIAAARQNPLIATTPSATTVASSQELDELRQTVNAQIDADDTKLTEVSRVISILRPKSNAEYPLCIFKPFFKTNIGSKIM